MEKNVSPTQKYPSLESRVLGCWLGKSVGGTLGLPVVPDSKGPVDMQFYHLSVTHTPEGRVGLLGHYRVAAQTMDLEWCFSRDGINWQRPHRCGWLPRGEDGAADCYGIYPLHSLVEHGGQWWLFYTGVNYAHNHKHSCGQPRSVILAATTSSLWK